MASVVVEIPDECLTGATCTGCPFLVEAWGDMDGQSYEAAFCGLKKAEIFRLRLSPFPCPANSLALVKAPHRELTKPNDYVIL